tara:strand:- start:1308 stop:2123 length:816 start_codon:yes stop_codon:yes gene_type:complete
MVSEKRIQGLSLKVGPLGENDRLLTVLTEKEGIIRIAIPGARRPKSSLAAAVPLTLIDLQVVGRRELKRVKQMKVLRSFTKLGQRIETLAAAQAITELTLMVAVNNDPQLKILETVIIHLGRLEEVDKGEESQILILAKIVQCCVHLLALGGYSIPVHRCSRSGINLEPPLGNWDWCCSLIPEEGFAIGAIPNSVLQLNPSELALLQRLFQPNLPFNKEGTLLGPQKVWLKLLAVIECWAEHHLPKRIRSLEMLREVLTISEIDNNKYLNS